MFIIGTGSVLPEGALEYRARYLYSGWGAAVAAARAAAMETARMAFAPRFPLFGEPSVSIMRRSSAPWSAASRPVTARAISPFTLATALSTPLPRERDL